MSFAANFDQSNKADWEFDITATDADTGVAIDFTGATIKFAVKDTCGVQVLVASVGSGISQPDANTISVAFTAAQMEALCVGTYNIGCVYQISSSTNQLLSGTVSIYDGVAQI